MLRIANGNKAASRIAHLRFDFVAWYESTKGQFPIAESDQTYDTVFFPFGRSDRAHVFLTGGNGPDNTTSHSFSCYQMRNHKWTPVYEVFLKQVRNKEARAKSSKNTSLVKSLLDLLSRMPAEDDGAHYKPDYQRTKRVATFAAHDLGLNREYVCYIMWVQGDLQVSLLSESRNGFPGGGDWFGVTMDPLTNQTIDGSVFFKRYGLPVETQELAQLRP